jgi:hypothetical protein
VMGVSVVPTTVWPCHGIANITLPSVVCGTIMALLAARKTDRIRDESLTGLNHGAAAGPTFGEWNRKKALPH